MRTVRRAASRPQRSRPHNGPHVQHKAAASNHHTTRTGAPREVENKVKAWKVTDTTPRFATSAAATQSATDSFGPFRLLDPGDATFESVEFYQLISGSGLGSHGVIAVQTSGDVVFVKASEAVEKELLANFLAEALAAALPSSSSSTTGTTAPWDVPRMCAISNDSKRAELLVRGLWYLFAHALFYSFPVTLSS